MSCLGVLFALTEKEAAQLKAVPRNGRFNYMYENIEDIYFDKYPEFKQELDKSWDAMHRMLTDRTLLYGDKCQPLCNVILGGEVLYGSEWEEEDGILVLKTPGQVSEIAKLLPHQDKEECRHAYDSINEEDYGFPLSEDDFAYTWEWMQGSLEFWQRAASEKRYVLFTADQ